MKKITYTTRKTSEEGKEKERRGKTSGKVHIYSRSVSKEGRKKKKDEDVTPDRGK